MLHEPAHETQSVVHIVLLMNAKWLIAHSQLLLVINVCRVTVTVTLVAC